MSCLIGVRGRSLTENVNATTPSGQIFFITPIIRRNPPPRYRDCVTC